MYRRIIGVLALAALAFAAGTTPAPASAGEAINPADFTNVITNPYYPLSTLQSQTYEGTEADGSDTIATRGVVTVLPDVKTVAGVRVLVVRDENFKDGELVESTLDYFAQHKDGSVYYFGEDVDNYEDGAIKDHNGSWHAGENGALPGIFMPAAPVAGQKFDQERAPGVAEDHSTVLETGLTVTTAAGTFSNCLKTEDVNPLDNATENKWYCSGVGFVRETAEDEELELVSSVKAPIPVPTAAAPAAPAPVASAPSGAVRQVTAPATGTGDGGDGGEIALWVAAAVAAALLGGGLVRVGIRR